MKKKLKINCNDKNNMFNKYEDIIKYNGYKYEEKIDNVNNIFIFFENLINHKDINAEILKEKCKETLNKFYLNKKFIKEIEFLENYPEFLNFYCNNIELKIFESINIALIAFICAYKIKIISLYKNNRVFFYNVLNPKKNKKISLFIVHKHGVNYFERFLSKNEQEKVNFDFKCLFNLKKVNIDYNKDNYKEDISKFTQIIIENLIFFPHIIEILDIYNEKKNILNSAQKELKNVFLKYKKSVNKNSVSLGKTFNFKENINLENLDPNTKNEILFGDLSPLYYEKFNPPGLNNYDFKNIEKNDKNETKKSEEEEIENLDKINNKEEIKDIKNENNEKNEFEDKLKNYEKLENNSKNNVETGVIYKYFKDNNYGFIKINELNEDLFFHCENIKDQKEITKQMLENIKNKKFEVTFNIHEYRVKNKNCKKAINICLKSN